MSMATETARKCSFEVNNSLPLPPPPSSNSKGSFFMVQIMVRILAIVFTVSAISVLVSSNQTVLLFDITIEAHYSNTSAFRFLLGADAVVFASSVLSLIFVCLLLSRTGSNPLYYFSLFLHDMVMMLLMMSGCSAASTVGYIGKHGEPTVGWPGVCDFVSKFCHQMMVSLLLSYLAFFCYLALNTVSAHKLYASSLFSKSPAEMENK